MDPGRKQRSERLTRLTRGGLYLITDDRLPEDELLTRLDDALAAGADVVQLRDKRPARGRTYRFGQQVAERCRAHHALFIVNDFADLAVALDADGVHVGQDDLPPGAVRLVVGPELLIGLSVSAISEAAEAAAGDADYLGFGALFPTSTKLDAEPAGPPLLAEARRGLPGPMPLVGIGGITAANVAQVIASGADAVAVVTAVFAAPDSGAATRELLGAISDARRG